MKHKINTMSREKSNKAVRNTIKSNTNLKGIGISYKTTLSLPGAITIKQNKNWIDRWMKQNASVKDVKANPIIFSKTSGLIMKWWEN